MYCPSCGQENDDNAQFCRICGANLGQSAFPDGSGIPLTRGCAGFWRRFAAYLIDSILFCILFFPIVPFMMIVVNPTDSQLLTTIIIVPILYGVLYWLYSSIMEASSKQATLGKMALGVIVTDEAGHRVSFGRATGRFFAKILSQYMLYIGYIMIAFMKNKQGLHDLLASTLVIKK